MKTASGNLLTFRSNEPLRIWLAAPHHPVRRSTRGSTPEDDAEVPRTSLTSGTLRLVDRAGNITRIKVTWK